jgi:HAD superfamily hydrolase (TIGR01490 family)
MPLALFDLDNTLINGDSDHLWGEFLVQHGRVDGDHYRRENDRFYAQYLEGSLNIEDWLGFQLAPLVANEPATLRAWRAEFMHEVIDGILLPAAQQLIDDHRIRGHTAIIITATNRFITEPIAARYGIDAEHLIATEPECDSEGRFTGKIVGTPCYQHGKITRLNAWMEQHGATLEDSHFYSDSHNDLPLLRAVTHPTVVHADPTLATEASAKGWPAIDLR